MPATSFFGNFGGGSTAASQPQSSGVFSNLNTNTSQTQAQPSIFSGLNTNGSQSQQQPSLFSNLGGGSTSQPPSNPFGGLGSSQQQTAAPGSGGLLGASNTGASQPQATSFFSAQNTSTSQPLQSSLFASTAAQPQQNQAALQPQQQQGGQLSNGLTGAPQPAYFDSLLERGRKRTNGGDFTGSSAELPSLHLGLGDISRRVRELGGSGGQAKRAKGQDVKT